MAKLVKFTSTKDIESKKEAVREARRGILEKAKQKYEKQEQLAEQARLRGEDTWMLPSIEERLTTEKQGLEKVKKRHKKEKKSKKKHKKKNKKKASSSGSESASDSEAQWVVKDGPDKSELVKPRDVPAQQLQRDSWMEDPFDRIATTSKHDIREKKRKEEEEEKRKEPTLGQHERELNPYWRQGGSGLPEDEKASSVKGAPPVDVSWLRKGYERCKQQAADEGRSLEDVAAERYGSLKKLEKMLNDAEKSSDRRHTRTERHRSRSPRSPDRDRRSFNRRSCSPIDRQTSHSNRRSRSPIDRSRDIHNRTSLSHDSNKSYPASRKKTFMKPGDTDDSDRTFSGSASSRGKFMKPGSSNVGSDSENGSVTKKEVKYSSKSDRNKDPPRWRRPDSKSLGSDSKTDSRESSKRHEVDRRSRRKSKSPESSSTSSSNESSEEDEEENEEDTQLAAAPVARILSEQEMNELGAKLVRAELMGDEDLASEIKSKLDAARELRKNPPKSASQRNISTRADSEEVLLTRTSKSGLVMPLPEESDEGIISGKKRRRKQKVSTHDDGDRVRYFDDDDKFSLKSLVEREKLGTAEDQNSMFARLAGRVSEKADDDYLLDDIIVSKAAQMQSEAELEQQNRAKAIFEHRKLSAAMDKCQFCFDKVPKHLIIAIGTKVYLCLPNYRSLTAGHCLIVPMQHATSATSIDEDVWHEIQNFRKTLVQLFDSKDQDTVFMETSMHLKHHPHMSIECVPMEKETGDLAPIYFKKAIQDSESEWSQNKKLVDLSKKDIRHAVPKGFPYFSVDFGLQGGFAHVIEEEHKFPSYFGKEIIGGMIDAEPQLWRKHHKETFDDQRRKVLQFAEWWKPFDWTKNLKIAV